MKLSRRDAIASVSAAALTTAVVTVPLATKAVSVKAALASDTVMLARVAEFHETYEVFLRSWDECSEHRAKVEAMPDCPNYRGPCRDEDELRARNKAHHEFLGAHGVWERYAEPNRINKRVGELVNAIFDTPAETLRGVLDKARILYMARGDYDDADNGDTDLEAHQVEGDSPWFGSVIADLERLAGSEPS